MSTIFRALLSTVPDVLGEALAMLDVHDATVVMVYALEYDDRAIGDVLRESAPFSVTNTTRLLQGAAVHGCFRAMFALRNNTLPRVIPKPPRSRQYIADATYSCDRRSARMAFWMHTYRQHRFPDHVMYDAARHGSIDAVRWLHATTEYAPFLAIEHAARAGQLACAQWLADHAHSALQRPRAEMLADVVVDVTTPFDPALGLFAWRAHNTATANRMGYSWHKINRSKQQLTAAVDTASGSSSDPVVYAIQKRNDELFDVLQQSDATHQWRVTQQALDEAAKHGRIDAIEWMLERDAAVEYDVVSAATVAAKWNHVALLQWLHARFADVKDAVPLSSLEVVQWACKLPHDVPVDDIVAHCVSAGVSRPELIMWLHASKGMPLAQSFTSLFMHSSLDAFKAFLFSFPSDQQRRDILTTSTLAEASRAGNLDIVQYLADEHGVWDKCAVAYGTTGEHMALMQWIRASGRPYERISTSFERLVELGGRTLLAEFAEQGRVLNAYGCWESVLSQLYRPRPEVTYAPSFPWCNSGPCGLANKKHVVEIMLEHWPHNITGTNTLGPWAACHGFANIVRRLIDLSEHHILSRANLRRILLTTQDGPLVQLFLERRNEPLTYALFQWAAKCKQVSLLAYLFARLRDHDQQKQRQTDSRCRSLKFDACVQLVASTASKFGHLGLLKWLVRSGIAHSSDCISPRPSARYGHVHILQWLYANSVMDLRVLARAVQASVAFGHVTVVQWYSHLGFEYCFEGSELERAVHRGDIALVQWIANAQPALACASESLMHKTESLLSTWQDILI